MISTYTNYLKNIYDTKKWFIDNNKANAIVSMLRNKLPNELIQLIIDSCYEEITFTDSFNWTDNSFVFDKNCEAYMLKCDTNDIKNLEIIFDNNWFKFFKQGYIRCHVIDSNNEHFKQWNFRLLKEYIHCSYINRGRKNCKHFFKNGTVKITLMYRKFSYKIC